MTIAERLRKHRERLLAKHYGRLDVWLGKAIIELVREFAKVHGRLLEAASR